MRTIAARSADPGRHTQHLARSLERALEIRRADDDPDVVNTLRRLCAVCELLGRVDAARAYGQEAVMIAQATGDRRFEALSLKLNNLGVVFIRQGSPDEAAELCLKALTIQRELDDRPRLGPTLNSLGETMAALERFDDAVAYLSEALTVARDDGDRMMETGAYLHLARTHQLSGQIPDAMRFVKGR